MTILGSKFGYVGSDTRIGLLRLRNQTLVGFYCFLWLLLKRSRRLMSLLPVSTLRVFTVGDVTAHHDSRGRHDGSRPLC